MTLCRPPGHQFRNVKRVKTTSAPTVLVAAAPECVTSERHPSGTAVWKKAVAIWASAGRRKKERWLKSADPIRFTIPEFWDWLDRLAGKGRRVFTIAPNAADLLTLGEFWSQVEVGRYDIWRPPAANPAADQARPKTRRPWLGRLIMRRNCDIITARGPTGSLMFCSSSNYLPASIAELAVAVGYELPPVDRDSPDGFPVEPTAYDQVAVLGRYYRQVLSRWIKEGNGPWRPTAATCALSLWQRKYLTVPVTRHREQVPCELESEACHGGRASTWYYGDVGELREMPAGAAAPPEPAPWSMPATLCHRIDYRSLYPSLLKARPFPIRFRKLLDTLPPSLIPAYCQHKALIARVELDTPHPEFPLRQDDRARYPIGRFWTTLAGPELLQAYQDGAIRTVGLTSVYDAGEPFRELMGYLLNQRQRCLKAIPPDLCGELWYKQLANSFGGKFGQKTFRWVPEPGTSADKGWGPLVLPAKIGTGADNGLAVKGLVFREERSGINSRLLAAVFAYLTSYARLVMREARATIGAADIVAQDTDCLWLTDRGAARAKARRLLESDQPGRLRVAGVASYSRFFSPRHYYQDGRWTLAGVAAIHSMTGPHEVRERTTVNPARRMPDVPPVWVCDRIRLKRLGIIAEPRHAGPDGWALVDEIDRRLPPASTPEPPAPDAPGLFDTLT